MAKIFVIDPSENDRELLKRALERAGHQVAECDGPAKGVPMALRTKADVMILEYDIYSFAQVIWDLKACAPQTKIVVFSDQGGGPEFVVWALRNGANAVVEKTTHADCFEAVVTKVAELLTQTGS